MRSLATIIFFIEGLQDLIRGTYDLCLGNMPWPRHCIQILCSLLPPKPDSTLFTVVDTIICIIIENILDTLHQFCRAVILWVVRGEWVYARSFAALLKGWWFTVGEMTNSAWLDAFLSDRKQLLFWRTLGRFEEGWKVIALSTGWTSPDTRIQIIVFFFVFLLWFYPLPQTLCTIHRSLWNQNGYILIIIKHV